MAKRKVNKWVWISLVAIVLILVGSIIVFLTQNKKPLNVQTSIVGKRTITQIVSAIGKIQPETEVKVSSQASGEIFFLGVKEGDQVSLNQPLVRIKPDIIETQLEQMRASVDASKNEIEISKSSKEKANNDLKRIKELFDKQFVSQQEYDAAKTGYDAAVSQYQASLARYQQTIASLKQIERSKDRTTIYAPLNGVVTLLNVKNGEKVLGTDMFQGTDMMRIADLNVMNAEVEVDEIDIVKLSIGDTAWIEIDAFPDRKFKGLVKEIGHSAITASIGTQDQAINYKVKIRLIDTDIKLRPGMSCNVEIETERKYNTLSIPLQAVTIREKEKEEKEVKQMGKNGPGSGNDEENKVKKERPKSVVFLYNNGVAKQVNVEIGISDSGFIEIISGLSEGDEVISGNFEAVSKLLNNGDKVSKDKVENKFKKK